MDYSTPGLPVLTNSQSPPKPTSIEWVMPSNHLILCRPFSSCPQSFPASGSFKMNQLFASGGQRIGVSASASACFSISPSNEYSGQISFRMDWLDLSRVSLGDWKGLSRVFSNTTVQKQQFFSTPFFYRPTLTSIHDYRKNHSFD